MLQDADEKVRLARRRADVVRRYSAGVKKIGKSLRLRGDEAKRLNCQHFRRLPRRRVRLLHRLAFAFP